MPEIRLPSFNDFSPGILNDDLRPVLEIVALHSRDENAIFTQWEAQLFSGWVKKRIRTNIRATLNSTGLIDSPVMELTSFGEKVRSAASAKAAAEVFCTEIINNHNGLKLIQAITNLKVRGEKTTKGSLQAELGLLGIPLSNDTTDHTTLKNWMIVAGIVKEERKGYPEVDDLVLKRLAGISSAEQDELQTLTEAQRIFVQLLARRHVTEIGPFNASEFYSECKATHPHLFVNADFASAVKDPLSEGGWIDVSVPTAGGRGGKAGWVRGTAKLLAIPLDRIIEDFTSVVPADLHPKLQTPLSAIKEGLQSSNTHTGGLALELLALRMILDLQLTPRDFRLRSKDSSYAEVDVTAEGDHLMFSRWTFQCKRIQKTKNVPLSDVAKEVGIAIYMRAHVIVMVSTGGFSSEAIRYANEIASATALQFLFIDKTVVQKYLTQGPAALHGYVMRNAKQVMADKRSQKISTS